MGTCRGNIAAVAAAAAAVVVDIDCVNAMFAPDPIFLNAAIERLLR